VLCLHTAEFMTAAVAMYEAMGFRRVPSYDFDANEHLRLGGEPVPILAYRLDLPRPATTGRPRFPNPTTVVGPRPCRSGPDPFV
jgi:hypothetical protein